LQKFYTAQLNPYLNFHRPCGFATISFDARGNRKRRYKLENYASPYQKLKSLPEVVGYLKDGITLKQLDRHAGTISDTRQRAKDEHGQVAAVARLQDRVAAAACAIFISEGRGNAGPMGKRGKPNPGFPLFPPSLPVSGSSCIGIDYDFRIILGLEYAPSPARYDSCRIIKVWRPH
jgi:hypothetical protein